MIAIVIPWRDSGDEHRARNFRYVHDYYKALGIGPVIVESDGREPGQPFNRSAAYNRGLARASSQDIILWNEADTLIPLRQIEAAAEVAAQQLGLVVPFTERHELNAAQTDEVHQGADPLVMRGAVVYPDGRSIGQAGVTSRATIDAIGGAWDEGFSGWGYDDNGMFHVFKELAGAPQWVTGPGVHLWHTPVYTAWTPQSRQSSDANAARFMAMNKLRGDDLRNFLSAKPDTT